MDSPQILTPGLDASASMFRYRLYGLAIASDVAFPELPEIRDVYSAPAPDVVLSLKDSGRSPPNLSGARDWLASFRLPDGSPWLDCARADGGFILRFAETAVFWAARDGRRVICRGSMRELAADDLRHVIIDQMMPRVLGLLGHHALHATAVLTRYGVCAFTGPSGCGKSTLAASFALDGYPCLGDDCLRLQPGPPAIVTPAYPGVRLWRDAFAALAEKSDASAFAIGADQESESKIRLIADGAAFSQDHQPLFRIYRVVRMGGENPAAIDAPRISRLTPREALIELLSQSFRLVVDDREMLAREFAFFRAIVEHVPVRRLEVPGHFSALPGVRRMILQDLEQDLDSH
ncbi:MAG: hypothetical protein ACREP6_06055 [Candidatus Binataceae bacterium]